MKRRLVSLLKPLLERFPGLASAYRFARDSRGLRSPAIRSPLGFLFQGNPVMASGNFEPVETRLVQRLLPHAELVVNVGANIGYYCCIALAAGKPVIAVEPIPLNARYLLKNIQLNHWAACAEVFQMALSDRPGIVEIYGGGTGASLLKGWAGTSESQVTLVPASTLDRIVAPESRDPRALLFIIDIEGAELGMLQGALRCLEMRPRPLWMVEIAISDHQPAGITINPHLLATFEMFTTRGYAVCTADEALAEVNLATLQTIVRSGVNTLTTHNFLFGEPGLLAQLRALP
jgi:FkbM family methyltransferase